ncbi:TPA: LysM peptidoglycan-binding domain-containing protein [Streptococcus suis]|nr:LysM peptidoglycan-binding domain-containing protein [Streptococcus suis]
MKQKMTLCSLLLGTGLISGLTAQAAEYQVQAGDSFSSIAAAHQIDMYQLAEANQMTIYDLLLPGQVLQVADNWVASPSASQETSYTVQYGDSLSAIAAKFGMDMYQLAQLNRMDIYGLLLPGQVLTVTATAQQVQTATSDYYLPGFTYEAGINYPVGQCTWAVQKLTGWAGDWWGNAADWARNAAAQGFLVGSQPQVGSIVVWDDGGYGHVAYVTEVNQWGQIQVLEANYNGQQWIDNYRGWFTPTVYQGSVSYIYPPAY